MHYKLKRTKILKIWWFIITNSKFTQNNADNLKTAIYILKIKKYKSNFVRMIFLKNYTTIKLFFSMVYFVSKT